MVRARFSLRSGVHWRGPTASSLCRRAATAWLVLRPAPREGPQPHLDPPFVGADVADAVLRARPAAFVGGGTAVVGAGIDGRAAGKQRPRSVGLKCREQREGV